MSKPLLGVVIAIAVTTLFDANDLSVFSALPLAPLLACFWWWEKFTRRDIGFAWGRPKHYALAVLYPAVVLSAATAIALGAGVVDTSATNWNHFWLNFLVGGSMTILITIVTEEGFFRGWLWASLIESGRSRESALVWSSVAFSLWHLSGVALDTGFGLPARQIPVFMVNAALLGLIWGMLRWVSGSVVVASVSHGLWNGLNYALFAFGTKTGALGVRETAIYGPEVGFVGLALNLAFAAGLWWWLTRRGEDGASGPILSG